MNYMPFNSVDHDRVYKAEDWAWYFSTFISNGVFPAPSDGLQVVAGDGMTIGVRPGYGFINGYAFRNQELYNLTISNADGSLDRIDRVVLRWDLVQRLMELLVLTGSPSKSPTAPALTRTADIWEIALADIAVTKGLTTVTQAQITDDRYNSSLCGICAGVITQIDASTLTAQFDSFFKQYTEKVTESYGNYTTSIEAYEAAWKAALDDWKASEQSEQDTWQTAQWQAFSEWLSKCEAAISDSTAATLTAEVVEHNERLDVLEHMTIQNDFFAPLLDDDNCPILDDDGFAILRDWKYKYA